MGTQTVNSGSGESYQMQTEKQNLLHSTVHNLLL